MIRAFNEYKIHGIHVSLVHDTFIFPIEFYYLLKVKSLYTIHYTVHTLYSITVEPIGTIKS